MSVVVGYVPSPEGEAALRHGVEQARRLGTRLVVVNSSRGDALVDERYALPEQVEALDRRLAEENLDHVLVHGFRGHDAADELLEAAHEHRADLIVIGVRRRSPLGKLIMGSTAQRVLLEALCPVLAVKAS
ncbi:MAG TPA: universal stress protein [Nocardioidaceae bacterium]|nr:universal stress protein [Nocardioidaceae bacterium]